MKNAFLLRFSQIKLPETLPWTDVMCCRISVSVQRNSVDAASFWAFVIELKPWLQEAESACQV